MKFTYLYQGSVPQKIKEFVPSLGISRGLLAKIKFQGGHIFVNGHEENVLFPLQVGDELVVEIPSESEKEYVLEDATPLDIVYEDEHLLVVNKPAGVPSIPVRRYPNGTMVNRVKHYIKEQQYENQAVHIVTRLDKDTSGLMLFAKHGFAHALLDQQLRQKSLQKQYIALIGGAFQNLPNDGKIERAIQRKEKGSMARICVDEGGQFALTEYEKLAQAEDFAVVQVQLHTGRTHQIRVHFASLACPLLGDTLYGGTTEKIGRQALHCQSLRFQHPFTQMSLHFQALPPEDFTKITKNLKKEEKNVDSLWER